MLYFFHHYELPSILHHAQIQHLGRFHTLNIVLRNYSNNGGGAAGGMAGATASTNQINNTSSERSNDRSVNSLRGSARNGDGNSSNRRAPRVVNLVLGNVTAARNTSLGQVFRSLRSIVQSAQNPLNANNNSSSISGVNDIPNVNISTSSSTVTGSSNNIGPQTTTSNFPNVSQSNEAANINITSRDSASVLELTTLMGSNLSQINNRSTSAVGNDLLNQDAPTLSTTAQLDTNENNDFVSAETTVSNNSHDKSINGSKMNRASPSELSPSDIHESIRNDALHFEDLTINKEFSKSNEQIKLDFTGKSLDGYYEEVIANKCEIESESDKSFSKVNENDKLYNDKVNSSNVYKSTLDESVKIRNENEISAEDDIHLSRCEASFAAHKQKTFCEEKVAKSSKEKDLSLSSCNDQLTHSNDNNSVIFSQCDETVNNLITSSSLKSNTSQDVSKQ